MCCTQTIKRCTISIPIDDFKAFNICGGVLSVTVIGFVDPGSAVCVSATSRPLEQQGLFRVAPTLAFYLLVVLFSLVFVGVGVGFLFYFIVFYDLVYFSMSCRARCAALWVKSFWDQSVGFRKGSLSLVQFWICLQMVTSARHKQYSWMGSVCSSLLYESAL